MDAEALYRLLARQLETMPDFPSDERPTPEQYRWLGKTGALIGKVDSISAIQFESAQSSLGTTVLHKRSVHNLTSILHRIVAKAELSAPAAVQGSFVATGQELDAYAAIAKVLAAAKQDVLIVDPYMDASVVFDFAPLAPDGVGVRLLTDEQSVKASFLPAVAKWKTQHASGPAR